MQDKKSLIKALVIKTAVEANKIRSSNNKYQEHKRKSSEKERVSGGSDVFSNPSAAFHASTEKSMPRASTIIFSRVPVSYSNSQITPDVNKNIEDKHVPEEQDKERKEALSSIEEFEAQAKNDAFKEIDYVQSRVGIDLSSIKREYVDSNNSFLYAIPTSNNQVLEMNRSMLMIQSVMFVMNQEGEELNKKDKKILDKIIKGSSLKYDRVKAKMIKEIVFSTITLDEIIDNTRKWGLTQNDILDFIKKMRNLFNEEKYLEIIKEMENHIKAETI